MYNLKIGADPEVFVSDKKTGQLVSAFNLIKGTKANPFKVKHGAVQVDGMALEFNIDPATSLIGFKKNIKAVMEQLSNMVPDHDIKIQSVAHFGKELIDSQPSEAKELGCEPDYNGWTENINPRPNADTPFRTASGHVHIGWTSGIDPHNHGHFKACCMLARQLDHYLGLPAIYFETPSERRSLYGAAGAFRPKSYGMEYRVLSNDWLKDDKLQEFVFRQSKKAFEDLVDGSVPRQVINKPNYYSNMCKNDTAYYIKQCNQEIIPNIKKVWGDEKEFFKRYA